MLDRAQALSGIAQVLSGFAQALSGFAQVLSGCVLDHTQVLSAQVLSGPAVVLSKCVRGRAQVLSGFAQVCMCDRACTGSERMCALPCAGTGMKGAELEALT